MIAYPIRAAVLRLPELRAPAPFHVAVGLTLLAPIGFRDPAVVPSILPPPFVLTHGLSFSRTAPALLHPALLHPALLHTALFHPGARLNADSRCPQYDLRLNGTGQGERGGTEDHARGKNVSHEKNPF